MTQNVLRGSLIVRNCTGPKQPAGQAHKASPGEPNRKDFIMSTNTPNLEYQNCIGNWRDCADRNAEFLAMCFSVAASYGDDESSVLAELAAGKTVRNHRQDWYSNCRDRDLARAKEHASEQAWAAEQAKLGPLIHCKRCGQTGYAGGHPFSTLSASDRTCDDCI